MSSKAYRGICLCEMFEDEKLKNRIVDRAKTIEDLIILLAIAATLLF